MTGRARDLAELLPVRVAGAVVGGLPPGLARAAGAGLGTVAGSALRVRRSVVERQIGEAFPDRSREWVRRTASACYRHFGREVAEIARLGRHGTADLPRRIREAGAARSLYRTTVGDGPGGIIVTGHLGNWEMAGALLAALGIPLAAVVKRQRNPRFDAWLRASRLRLGIEPIYMEDAYEAIPAALERQRGVALVADQDARLRGIFVTFLGRPASTFRGPARVALAEGVPLFFGAVVRDPPEYRAILERVAVPEPGPEAEKELTQRWVSRLEHHVRRWPEQYFWFHRRWKTLPPGPPAGGVRVPEAAGADGTQPSVGW